MQHARQHGAGHRAQSSPCSTRTTITWSGPSSRDHGENCAMMQLRHPHLTPMTTAARFVNFASGAGTTGSPGHGPDAAAKESDPWAHQGRARERDARASRQLRCPLSCLLDPIGSHPGLEERHIPLGRIGRSRSTTSVRSWCSSRPRPLHHGPHTPGRRRGRRRAGADANGSRGRGQYAGGSFRLDRHEGGVKIIPSMLAASGNGSSYTDAASGTTTSPTTTAR